MHTRSVDGITVRPLRNGDTATVAAVLARAGRPDWGRLEDVARVNGASHALVAYVSGDARPAGLARVTRRGGTAELLCAVAGEHAGGRIASVLARELEAVARAAGVTSLPVAGRELGRAERPARRLRPRASTSWRPVRRRSRGRSTSAPPSATRPRG
jgi:hypothetical protein